MFWHYVCCVPTTTFSPDPFRPYILFTSLLFHPHLFSLNFSKTHLLKFYTSTSIVPLIISTFMASFWSFLVMLMISMAYHSSLALESQLDTRFSTISAAPALSPGAPLSSSPTLSPDISPLFPSPSGVPVSPSESSLPTIPSNPSPPNPEATIAPGPGMAFAPSGSMPVSLSVSITSSPPLNVIFFLGLLVVCVMQVSGV